MAIMDPTLRRADEALRSAAGSLGVEELSSDAGGKWTIAQILEHLGRAFSATALGTQRALDRGRPQASRPSLRQRFIVWLVVEVGYFPTGRKSPKVAEPVGADPSGVVAETLLHLEMMDNALAFAAQQFGSSIKFLDHPILGPLSIRQWRRFHWVHTRHHVRQIAARVGRARVSRS